MGSWARDNHGRRNKGRESNERRNMLVVKERKVNKQMEVTRLGCAARQLRRAGLLAKQCQFVFHDQ